MCAQATRTDTEQSGQGWQGYDTSYDTASRETKRRQTPDSPNWLGGPGCSRGWGASQSIPWRAVIDAYDAMISNRCYRRGLSHDEAVQRLVASGGTQFDPVVVQTFVEIAREEAAEVFEATGVSRSAVI